MFGRRKAARITVPIELLDPSEVPARLAQFGEVLAMGARVLPDRHRPTLLRQAAQSLLSIADRMELADAVREARS